MMLIYQKLVSKLVPASVYEAAAAFGYMSAIQKTTEQNGARASCGSLLFNWSLYAKIYVISLNVLSAKSVCALNLPEKPGIVSHPNG